MNKEAFLSGVMDSIKDKFPYLKYLLSNPMTWKDQADKNVEFTQKFLKPTLDTVFSHNTGSALMGGLAGAAAGNYYAPSKEDKLKSTLKGAAGGAGLGLAGSLAIPEASKAINEAVLVNPLRKLVGLLATNTRYPMSYTQHDQYSNKSVLDPDLEKQLKGSPIKSLTKALIKDEPLYSKKGPRLPIYRASFGLNSRPEDKAFDDLFVRPVGQPDSMWYNEGNPEGKRIIETVRSSINDALSNPKMLPRIAAGEKIKVLIEDPYVMARAMADYNPETDSAKISDVWDFALHPDEKLNTSSNWARYLVDRVLKKQTMQGEVKHVLNNIQPTGT